MPCCCGGGVICADCLSWPQELTFTFKASPCPPFTFDSFKLFRMQQNVVPNFTTTYFGSGTMMQTASATISCVSGQWSATGTLTIVAPGICNYSQGSVVQLLTSCGNPNIDIHNAQDTWNIKQA